jgi:hypothetical protein
MVFGKKVLAQAKGATTTISPAASSATIAGLNTISPAMASLLYVHMPWSFQSFLQCQQNSCRHVGFWQVLQEGHQHKQHRGQCSSYMWGQPPFLMMGVRQEGQRLLIDRATHTLCLASAFRKFLLAAHLAPRV